MLRPSDVRLAPFVDGSSSRGTPVAADILGRARDARDSPWARYEQTTGSERTCAAFPISLQDSYMNRLFRSSLLASIAVTALSACGPENTPEGVCTHLDEINAETWGHIDSTYVMTDHATCLASLTPMQTEDPEAFRLAAECINALSTNEGEGLYACHPHVRSQFPHGFRPRPAAPVEVDEANLVQPVTNPRMDARTVEPCVVECGGASNSACWDPCLTRRANEINAGIH